MDSRLYRRVYAILGGLTPLRADCGSLCGAKCCEGDDDVGMLLWPGEEKLLSDKPFLHLSPYRLGELELTFASCGGAAECVRAYRPLSCRIFPLTPYMYEDGRVAVIPDPRAKRLCPLADGDKLDPEFCAAVRRAVRLLATDPDARAYIKELSRVLDEYRKFIS